MREETHRSREGYFFHIRMSTECFTNCGSIGHACGENVEHALRKACFSSELHQCQYRDWSLRARFDDHGTSRCECRTCFSNHHAIDCQHRVPAEIVHDLRDGKVPRRQSGHYANRLLQRKHLLARYTTIKAAPLYPHRLARKPIRARDRIIKLAKRLSNRLPGLVRDDRGKILFVLLDELAPTQQRLAPPARADLAVDAKGGLSG